MRQVVVDINTTGLEPEQGHRIVEIAAVEMIDSELTGNTFHHYLNPDRPMSPNAVQAAGITPEFLFQQPRFHDIAEAFLGYVRDAELIIHNAAFDVVFIEAELLRSNSAGFRTASTRIIDTLSLARQLHPGERNNLASLCARYHVDWETTHPGGSLRDALLLAEVYIAGFASLRMDLPKSITAESNIWTPDMDRELLAHLRRNPSAVFNLSPRRFEELVAAIFRNNGFTVELTPQTHDGGVDIIAVQHSAFTGELIHLIECKRYHPSRKVGIGVVQRLLGTVTQRRATKGIVVATSSFSRDAIRVAKETRHVIALNDYKSIVGWLYAHDSSQ